MAVLAVALLLIVLAAAYPAHRASLVGAAEVTAAIAGVLALFALYRQIQLSQATQRGLHTAEERAGEIADSAMDPIITIDEAKRVVMFNTAAEETFGLTREQVIGKPVDMLLPERFRTRHRDHIEKFAQTGTASRRMGAHAVLTGLRAGGEEFPIEASISHTARQRASLHGDPARDGAHAYAGPARASEAHARHPRSGDGRNRHGRPSSAWCCSTRLPRQCSAPPEEALGMPSASPDRFRGVHADHVAIRRRSVVPANGRARIVTGLRRDGDEFPIDASISHVTDGDEKFYTVILRDVSARVHAWRSCASRRRSFSCSARRHRRRAS
jgi:PAS domain S-box-containing protein